MDEYIKREAAIDAVDVGNLHRGIVDALQSIIDVLTAKNGGTVTKQENRLSEKR